MCMNLEATWPYLHPISLIQDFIDASKAGSNHNFVMWVWTGETCKMDDPAFEMVVSGKFCT